MGKVKKISVIVVGFAAPEKSRLEGAQLPDGVLLWSFDDIPKDGLPEELKADKVDVFYHSALKDPKLTQLHRLFVYTFPLGSIGRLEVMVCLSHGRLGKLLADYLVPADSFRVSDPKAADILGFKPTVSTTFRSTNRS